MIRKGMRIKTPSQAYIRTYNKYNNSGEYYSFLYNVGKVNPETKKFETQEHYTINVMNIKPNPDSDIDVVEILTAKPVIKTSKDGREFLQCEVSINAENYSQPVSPTYRENAKVNPDNQQNNNVERPQEIKSVDEIEDDFPF